jgi:hypothetical protein
LDRNDGVDVAELTAGGTVATASADENASRARVKHLQFGDAMVAD